MARCAAAVGYADGVVTAASPGKTFNLAGLHAAFLVIPSPRRRAQYDSVVTHAALSFGSAFATTGMLAAYSDPASEAWLDQLRKYLERNVLVVESYLSEHTAPEITVAQRPQATYLVWLNCQGLSLDGIPRSVEGQQQPSALSEWLESDAGVKLSDGWSFGGAESSQYQRINVACAQSLLMKGLQRLGAAVGRRRQLNNKRLAHTTGAFP